jgi:ATP-dependent DNA helicase RecQ
LSPVWAPTIRSGIKAGTYDGQLAKAMEELARAEFAGCNIRWATFVPSAFQPALIEGLAQTIASQLRLPLLDLLEKTPNKSPDEMNTAFTQASNALDGYRLKDAPPDTPGLLITDLVESRWSLTVAGFHLRKAGAQKVYPLVLADASNF